MPRKRYSTEQIVTKLRQAEVELGRGLRTPQVCKKLGISEQTYYRWRKEYGGLGLDQAKRLKALVELTRFRGHLILLRGGGIHDAEHEATVSGGIPAADGRSGSVRTHAGGVDSGV